ncbi:hypothetical protein K438DRAFT_1672236 [Mycena galopus ATCC 62051]|nr:hypothetical protein K438DRAFT_1672236 [Mycena galopus ATCC 62051]
MASSIYNDEYSKQELSRGKKRLRLQRACDVCRRKKIGCDGSQVQGQKCTTCVVSKLECTYEATVKRPPPKSYLELETRLEQSQTFLKEAEALVRQLRAELANTQPSNSPPYSSSSSFQNVRTPDGSVAGQNLDTPSAALRTMRTALHNLTAAPPAMPRVDPMLDLLTNKFEVLKLSAAPLQNHISGPSSTSIAVDPAMDLKFKAGLKTLASRKDVRGEDSKEEDAGSWSSKRPRYWMWKPKGQDDADSMRHTLNFKFPPDEILADLIELYFMYQNLYVPILHGPIFKRGVAEGLHLRDDGFAATVLLVCAIGSRWSTDPSIAGDGLDCGWGLFNQVKFMAGNHLLRPTVLYDLQYYCLASVFLLGSMPQASLTFTCFGLRLAVDMGLHRSKDTPASAEGELLRRAYWVLVYLETRNAFLMGRILTVRYSDFDAELPLEVDDEYWDDPTHPFQQPPHKPSRIAYFNALLGLNHIMGFSLLFVYPLKKVRNAFSIDDAWIEQAVAELDSALNLWRNQIPEHLLWDPAREDAAFFDQSVFLHCSFYFFQIIIHRPRIPKLRLAPTMLPSSLTICTSAARACANMVDTQRRRGGMAALPLNLNAILTAGLVLSGLQSDQKREIANVHKCIEVIRLCENRWPAAGLFWKMLMSELAAGGQVPLPDVPVTPQESYSDLRPAINELTPMNVFRNDATLSSVNLPRPQDSTSHNFGLPSDPAQVYTPYSPLSSSALFAGGVAMPAGSDNAPLDGYIYNDAAQASRELENLSELDRDIIAVWTNAYLEFGADNEGAYFSNIGEMPQGQDDWAFEARGLF